MLKRKELRYEQLNVWGMNLQIDFWINDLLKLQMHKAVLKSYMIIKYVLPYQQSESTHRMSCVCIRPMPGIIVGIVCESLLLSRCGVRSGHDPKPCDYKEMAIENKCTCINKEKKKLMCQSISRSSIFNCFWRCMPLKISLNHLQFNYISFINQLIIKIQIT